MWFAPQDHFFWSQQFLLGSFGGGYAIDVVPWRCYLVYFHLTSTVLFYYTRYPFCQIVWVLISVLPTSSSGDNSIYCYSLVGANFYHPAEVPEWVCESGERLSGCDCVRM